jgi:serine/threonine-protein kinase
MVGTKLDNTFEVASLIGLGSTSRIYKARQELADRDVALKIMLPELTASPVARNRFKLETRVLGYMTHPGIISIYDSRATGDGRPYLVLELANGKPLSQILEDTGPLTSQVAIDVFQQACMALHHCHQFGVVHRGLNPADIIIDSPEGEMPVVKIVDFGSARSKPEDEDDELVAGLDKLTDVIGSSPYMSPEQRQSKPVDARSDVYALGCVMFEALTGRPPYAGGSLDEITQKHLHEEPPSLEEVWSCPASLANTVLRAMSRDPKARFKNMGEMGQALGGRSTKQVKMLKEIGNKFRQKD